MLENNIASYKLDKKPCKIHAFYNFLIDRLSHFKIDQILN